MKLPSSLLRWGCSTSWSGHLKFEVDRRRIFLAAARISRVTARNQLKRRRSARSARYFTIVCAMRT